MNTILRSTVFYDKSRKIEFMQNIIHHIFKYVLIFSVLIIGNSKVVSANEKVQRLYIELKQSKTESAARAVENKIWQKWVIGPNTEATNLLAKAMERRRAYDFAGSLEILNKVVEKTPNWAEGWNQ